MANSYFLIDREFYENVTKMYPKLDWPDPVAAYEDANPQNQGVGQKVGSLTLEGRGLAMFVISQFLDRERKKLVKKVGEFSCGEEKGIHCLGCRKYPEMREIAKTMQEIIDLHLTMRHWLTQLIWSKLGTKRTIRIGKDFQVLILSPEEKADLEQLSELIRGQIRSN